jgi:hypothetical protein
MPCHAMHPIQDLFLESFSYALLSGQKIYSCKKWVLHSRARRGVKAVRGETFPRLGGGNRAGRHRRVVGWAGRVAEA